MRQYEAYKLAPTSKTHKTLRGVRIRCKLTGHSMRCSCFSDVLQNAIVAINAFWETYPREKLGEERFNGNLPTRDDVKIDIYGLS